jgi:hypothetical protein
VAPRPNDLSGKNELSCNRLELDSIQNLTELGESNRPHNKTLYGFGCTSIGLLKEWKEIEVRFTPDFDSKPPNPSHVDIYAGEINAALNIGEAQEASENYKRESFKEIWKPYELNLCEEGQIIPYNLRDFILSNQSRIKA